MADGRLADGRLADGRLADGRPCTRPVSGGPRGLREESAPKERVPPTGRKYTCVEPRPVTERVRLWLSIV